MNTKQTSVAFAIIMIIFMMVSMLGSSSSTKAETVNTFPYAGAGDCYANVASGDFYPRGQNDSHCNTGSISHATPMSFAVLVMKVTVTPVVSVVAVIDVAPVVVVDADVTPVVIIVIEPVVEPVQEEDTACKNKNAGKDGTPDECNAGKGQEKKDN